jgi:hypothetical protein
MTRMVELAESLLRAGWTVEDVRRELRLCCDGNVTCSAVEEALREALKAIGN